VFNSRGLVCGCELSSEVHTADTGDVLGKQASNDPHDTCYLYKHCPVQIGEGDWLW
jgi:hypothetical protein